jgi:flagellar basal body-associated protein FliL
MTTVNKEENTGQHTDDINEPENSESKIFPEKKILSKMPWQQRWNRKFILFFIWGTFIFFGLILYPFLKDLVLSSENPQKSRPASQMMPSKLRQVNLVKTQVKRFPVQSDQSVKFDSFIIPFEEQGKFTYISLSISFELPNKELVDEMNKKNTLIRGIIYSLLNENIKILTTVSSLEELKALITHNVNGVLTAGKVNEPTITDFSTV